MFAAWCRQDKLILHAIIASLNETFVLMIALCKTIGEAMSKLKTSFASRTRLRIMSLKNNLSQSTQGTKTVAEFLHYTKSISDELALANSPVAEYDIIISILN